MACQQQAQGSSLAAHSPGPQPPALQRAALPLQQLHPGPLLQGPHAPPSASCQGSQPGAHLCRVCPGSHLCCASWQVPQQVKGALAIHFRKAEAGAQAGRRAPGPVQVRKGQPQHALHQAPGPKAAPPQHGKGLAAASLPIGKHHTVLPARQGTVQGAPHSSKHVLLGALWAQGGTKGVGGVGKGATTLPPTAGGGSGL